MRLRIHRGTKEIGGTCIEAEAEGRRLVLDVGLPLDAPDEAQDRLLPDVPGFREPDDSLLGVVISHAHLIWHGTCPAGSADLDRRGRPQYPWVPNGHRLCRSAASFRPDTGRDRAVPRHAVPRRSQRLRRLRPAGRGGGQTGLLFGRLPRPRPQGGAVRGDGPQPAKGYRRAADGRHDARADGHGGGIRDRSPTSKRASSRRSGRRMACTSSGPPRRTSTGSSRSSAPPRKRGACS